MLQIGHRRGKSGWEFISDAHDRIQGGGRTFEKSAEAAEHAVRQYLSQLRGADVSLVEVRAQTQHVAIGHQG